MSNNIYTFFVKYGELVLKKGNREMFLNILSSNIQKAFFDFHYELKKQYDYLLLTLHDSNRYEESVKILANIPGIAKFSLVKKLPLNDDLKAIVNLVQEELKQAQTFRVTVKRKDKTFNQTSMQFAQDLATIILQNFPHLKVDLSHYDFEVKVEIHHDGFYVLTNEHMGMKGLPVSKSNRTLVLISGGIDSPVAAKLMLKKGFYCDFITFISPPYTSTEAKNKTIDLFKKVTLNGRICHSKLYIINYTAVQNEIAHISNQAYKINLMRRSFFRIAEHLGRYLHIYSLTTGESLGQVASQTIESMRTISLAIDPYFLIFRPLLAFDKEEIITKAKQFETYDCSILPYADSCSLFAPKKPVTIPELKISKMLESEVDLLSALEQEVIKKQNMEIIYANEKQN